MSDVRVLIVDDEADMRALIRYTLEFEGEFEVIGEANDASDAVSLARRLNPDAVVLDVLLPDSNGIDAAAEIGAAAGEHCVVTLLTALYEDESVLAAAKVAGVPVCGKAEMKRLPQLLKALVR